MLFNPFSSKLTGLFSNLINRPCIPCMRYHVKAIDLCILKIVLISTKEVVALRNNGFEWSEGEGSKSENLHYKLYPKLTLFIKVSALDNAILAF